MDVILLTTASPGQCWFGRFPTSTAPFAASDTKAARVGSSDAKLHAITSASLFRLPISQIRFHCSAHPFVLQSYYSAFLRPLPCRTNEFCRSKEEIAELTPVPLSDVSFEL